MATNTKFVQSQAIALYTGMSTVATTARITPYPIDLDGNKLTMTDFGTTGFMTVDPKIYQYEEIMSFTGIIDNGDNTATVTGITRDLQSKSPYTGSGTGKQHGSSAVVVFSNNPQLYNKFPARDNDETITGQWTFNVFPITPATPLATNLVAGFTKLSVAAASPTVPIAVGDNDPRVPSANPTTLFAPLSAVAPSGIISPYAARTAPSGWLMCDGSNVSRTGANAALFAVLCPSGTFTVTIASPAVFTRTSHGFLVGDRVHLTTTGGLPSGLATNTDYYVNVVTDANTFQLALSPGGPSIITTGSQNGTHTVYYSAYGKGDGSTTFTLPDFRARTPMAVGVPASYSVLIDSSNVTLASPSVFTIPADAELYQGQKIVLTTSGTLPTGFTPGSTYYVIRASQNATTIQLASSQALANAGTGVNGSVSQTGVHTLTYTAVSNRTILGRVGGEELHGNAQTELASHVHLQQFWTSGGSNADHPIGAGLNSNGSPGAGQMTPTGGDAQHNNISPFLTIGGYIIKQ